MRAIIENFLKQIFLVLTCFTWCAVAGRCLFFGGKCVEHCPFNMHVYHTRCDVDTFSQRTCEFPERYILGFTCGWSRCDCNGDLVLSPFEGCIPLSDCAATPTHPLGKKRRRRRKGKRYGRLRDSADIDEIRKGLEPVHHMGDYPTNIVYEPPGMPQKE